MALKFKVAARDDIPEEQRAFYVDRDGVWLPDVEGTVEKSKLDEFRANNTALLRQLDEHTKRFEGIDLDEVRKLAEEVQRLEGDWDRVKSAPTDLGDRFVEGFNLVHPRWSGVAFDVGKAGLHSNGRSGLISGARSTDL